MEEEQILVTGLISGVFFLFAIFGSSRPVMPLLAAAGVFFVCVLLFGGKSTASVGAAAAIAIFVCILVAVAFVAATAFSFASKQKVAAFSDKTRLVLLGIGFAVIGLSCLSAHSEDIGSVNMEEAIESNSPRALSMWRSFGDVLPGKYEYELIINRYGLSEDSLELLRALGYPSSDIWPIILAFPASPERLDFLREIAGMEPDSVHPKFFIQAMDAGDAETADLLYPFVYDPDVAMVRAERLDLLRDVIRRGFPDSPEPYRSAALKEAAHLEPEYTRVLLEAGMDPDVALDRAVIDSGRNAGVARMLLDAGADPNFTDAHKTPLHNAAAWGTDAGIDLLLAAGADPNAHNSYDGCSPLHYAAIFGNTYAAARLLEHGAAVAARDIYDMTPLHWAAWRGDPEMAALLLAAGAPPDEPNAYDKLTPLFHAANLGGAPALAVLLETASPELKNHLNKPNSNGKTPWDIAAAGYSGSISGYAEKAARVGVSLESLGAPEKDEAPDLQFWQHSQERRAECVRLLLAAGADPTHLLPDGADSTNPSRTGDTIFHSLFDWRLGKNYFSTVAHDGRGYRHYELSAVGKKLMPAMYPQPLRGLLSAGVPLPEVRAGHTYDKYCAGMTLSGDADEAERKILTDACVAALTEEKARREAAGSL